MSEWISVKDRMPEDGQPVLIWAFNRVQFGELCDEFFVGDECAWKIAQVSHWMPMPTSPHLPPKDQSEVMAIKPKVLLCFPGDTATVLRILSQQ